MELKTTVPCIRFVMLTHLEYLYLRKWMHQNYSNKDKETIRFPGGVTLSKSTPEDYEKLPELGLLEDSDKTCYLLKGTEQHLDKCSRIINVWYGEYKKEVAHYVAKDHRVFSSAECSVEKDFAKPEFRTPASLRNLKQLEEKFRCTNSHTRK